MQNLWNCTLAVFMSVSVDFAGEGGGGGCVEELSPTAARHTALLPPPSCSSLTRVPASYYIILPFDLSFVTLR